MTFLPRLHHPDMQLPELLRQASDGAPIIRSSARWFIGNSTTSFVWMTKQPEELVRD